MTGGVRRRYRCDLRNIHTSKKGHSTSYEKVGIGNVYNKEVGPSLRGTRDGTTVQNKTEVQSRSKSTMEKLLQERVPVGRNRGRRNSRRKRSEGVTGNTWR